MTKLPLEANPNIIGTVGTSRIRQFASSPTVFFFRAGLNVDADGGVHSYNPSDSALDYTANAGTPGNYWALAVDKSTNKPFIQSKSDAAPGYYISTTALEDQTKSVNDLSRYVNSESIPYIVLPVAHRFGAQLGDICLVYNSVNQKMCGAIFADLGPNDSIGEGSIALAKLLDINADPKHGGVEDGIAYIVFTGSKLSPTFPINTIAVENKAKSLFANWGGMAKLQLGIPSLF